MFWRLFGTSSLLLVASLSLLGWMMHSRVQSYLVDGIRQSLAMKTVLVRELIAQRDLDSISRQAQMSRVARETESRITLITSDGTVLSDSDERPEVMDNHRTRPEVLQAEANGVGSATRFSQTIGRPMMYVARRMDTGPVRYVRFGLSLATVEEQTRWLRQALWTAMGASLVMALLMSVALARRMSAPLVELANAARSISEGCGGQQVKVASSDEIGTLAAAFNEMSHACAANIAQMELDRQRLLAIFGGMVEGVLVLDPDRQVQFHNEAAGRLLNLPSGAVGTKLWHLVRHRQLAEAVEKVLSSDKPFRGELEWNSPEYRVLVVHGSRLPGEELLGSVLVLHDVTNLRRLERIRQDFVANVSHELKTPLAAIRAVVETLLDGTIHDAEHTTRFLQRARENADRLHRLVQDLLTLSRVESGEVVMDRQMVSVQAAIESCVWRHEHLLTTKNLKLNWSQPAEPVMAFTDDDALAEILDNLLDNAIKYTRADGEITMRWFTDDCEAVIEVQATGIGIPEKH